MTTSATSPTQAALLALLEEWLVEFGMDPNQKFFDHDRCRMAEAIEKVYTQPPGAATPVRLEPGDWFAIGCALNSAVAEAAQNAATMQEWAVRDGYTDEERRLIQRSCEANIQRLYAVTQRWVPGPLPLEFYLQLARRSAPTTEGT